MTHQESINSVQNQYQLVKFLKSKISRILIASLLAIAMLPVIGQAMAATSTQTSPVQATKVVSATGNGWFIDQGYKDNFNFFVTRGTLKANEWRYNPNGQVSFTGKNFNLGNGVVQVWSTKVWRYKIEKIDGGNRVIIAGLATVKVGNQLRSNWWFRVAARDIIDANTGKDGFMMQLWRPIGADKTGGWTPKDFNPEKPATLKLNETAFYQARGTLRSGNVAIKP